MMDETRVGLAVITDKAVLRTNSPYQDAVLLSQLLKEAMKEGGLGRKNPDIPLADIIEPGMSVLLKPNWVLHYNQKRGCGMDCMITHPFFIKAVLKEVFAIASTLSVLYSLYDWLLASQGHGGIKISTVSAVIMASSNILFIYCLISRFALYGVIFSLLLSYVVGLAFLTSCKKMML